MPLGSPCSVVVYRMKVRLTAFAPGRIQHQVKITRGDNINTSMNPRCRALTLAMISHVSFAQLPSFLSQRILRNIHHFRLFLRLNATV